MINPETFLKDPEKYLKAGAVILTGEEYAEYETLNIVRQRASDELIDHDIVFDRLQKRAEELKANNQ